MSQHAGDLLRRPSVPISYVLLTLALAEEQGVSRAQLLRGVNVERGMLEDPQAHLSLAAYRNICLRAMEATADGGLGLAFGLRAPVTAHGMVGFGLMSQATLRQVFRFGAQFGAPLRLPAWDLHFRLDADEAVIDAVESVRYEPLHIFACDQLLASLTTLLRALLPQVECRLYFPYAEPAHFRRYADALPPAEFGTGVTQLRVMRDYLDTPLASADAIAAKQAEHDCVRAMARLNPPADFIGRVRAVLAETPGSYPDLGELAARLHVSPRTLVRRLQLRGSSFRQLLDEARRRECLALLEDPTLKLEQVAERLGYSNAPSFNRAFRKWTGTTPGVWRHRLAATGEP